MLRFRATAGVPTVPVVIVVNDNVPGAVRADRDLNRRLADGGTGLAAGLIGAALRCRTSALPSQFTRADFDSAQGHSQILSCAGERLSEICFAVSAGMLGRTATWQLQVPSLAGTLELNALVSSGPLEVLSW